MIRMTRDLSTLRNCVRLGVDQVSAFLGPAKLYRDQLAESPHPRGAVSDP